MVFIVIVLVGEGVPLEVWRTPDPVRLVAAFGALVAAVLVAGWSWSRLMEGSFVGVGLRYLAALPAKHIPGGFGLPLSQISHETSKGASPTTVFVRLVQHFLISISSGGIASLTLLGVSSEPWGPVWWLAGFLALFGTMSHPKPVGAVLERLGREDEKPASAHVVFQAALATTAALGLMGLSFVTLLDGLAGASSGVTVAALFVLSWTLGFAAVPVPAGIGLREAVLVGAVGSAPAALVILASLLFRLLGVVADVLVALAVRVFRPPE